MWRDSLFPICAFAAVQLLCHIWFLRVAKQQGQTFLELAKRWDGGFFLEIANVGYGPSQLSTAAVSPKYAFYPLYPMVLRGLGKASNIDVLVLAPLVSLLTAGFGVVMFHAMTRQLLSQDAARGATLALCSATASPVFQMAYSDGLAFALVVAIFWAFVRHRWPTVACLLPLLALARPIILPIGLGMIVAVLIRWRGSPPLVRSRELTLALFAVSLAGLWPLISAVMTGIPEAIFVAERAFQTPGARRNWFAVFDDSLLGILIMIALMAVLLWVTVRFYPRGTPLVFKTFTISYVLFLGLAVLPTTNILRFLLIAFPMALTVIAPKSRLLLAVTVGVGLVTQALWITYVAGSLGPHAYP